ncbi:protein kinase domain-containing protein [Coleofasciculus chthonoplastes]|uniref:protein kinase domain-containing protein n=1 Tax=Coleofasciculus chthonoplastes TaxID=64178 RepID=UPI0032F11DBA
MSAKVTLIITEGSLKGQQFIFDSRTTCIIGRAKDCHPQLPNDNAHSTISRYHCLLDINPPDIRVRDFGSRNGTYVNGKIIGQRQPNQSPEEGAKLNFPEYDLKDGDEIKLGNTVFQIGIEVTSIEETTQTLSLNQLTEQTKSLSSQQPSLPTIPTDDPNLTILGNYTIEKLLGKGGFGEVYLARHNLSNERVALKIMRPQIAAKPLAIEMFQRETENTKALTHPNVVQLRDYGYHDGTFFLTLDYCDGGSVFELMQQRGGCLPIDEAVPIILQALDGLDYAHNAEIPYVKLKDGTLGKGRGLVHRDIKPSNLLLSNVNGSTITKVADYGLAKAFDQAGLSGLSMSGSTAGTPHFMPRQQVINFKYAKPEVDVWAIAASLYYMLTSTFPRTFIGDPFLAVLKTNALPIRNRNASIPKPLAEVIDLALVDKPEIYFQTASDFKQALLTESGL